MRMKSARVALGRIIEQRTTGALPDLVDDIYGKVRAHLEAFAVRAGVQLTVRVHDLSCRDFANKYPER